MTGAGARSRTPRETASGGSSEGGGGARDDAGQAAARAHRPRGLASPLAARMREDRAHVDGHRDRRRVVVIERRVVERVVARGGDRDEMR